MGRKCIIANQRGQSLIQILISAALISMLALAFASMLSGQYRQTAALAEKLGALDLQKLLTGVLSDGSVCTYQLTTPTAKTFDASKIGTSNPPIIDLGQSIPVSANAGAPPAVQVNSPASAISNTLYPTSITLQNISGTTAGNQFTGHIQVAFDNSKLLHPIHPVDVQVTLATTGTGSTKTIASCLSSYGSSSSGGLSPDAMCASLGGTWNSSASPQCALPTNYCNGQPIPTTQWGPPSSSSCQVQCNCPNYQSVPGTWTCTAAGWSCITNGWACPTPCP